MDDIMSSIDDYCCAQSTLHEKMLDEIERTTHLKTLSPRMLSGYLQGSFLSLISKIKMPENILEIGTFTGYSAICLAQGLSKKGKLVTIEYDEVHGAIADSFFSKSSYNNQIELIIGDAKEIIPTLNIDFDLVFIDADKASYVTYYNLVIDRCNSGAIIIADNVLWNGKVIEKKLDKKTKLLDDFNKMIKSDTRVENVILPLRDGINVIRKK
ncbi:MAG: O-methyltransferase [Saprospiraceae bacterium]|nr:O-methyltransferase [Saprospiraceae bacterium]